MSVISNMILRKSTIKNNSTRRLTASDIGEDLFQQWKDAMVHANYACYVYKHAIDLRTHNMKVDMVAIEQKAYNSIKAIFDMVGEVSNRDMKLDKSLFDEFAQFAVRETTELAGRALTVYSQIKNLEKELENVTSGVRQEWLTAKQTELAEKQTELSALKKMTESGKDVSKRVGEDSFRGAVEKRLSKIIADQSMKSAEQIDAERKAEKDRKKALRKAERQAAAQAKKAETK